MDSPASADHNLIAHEPGKRILGVAARTGKVIELRAVPVDASNPALVRLERLENGAVTNPAVFTGPTEQAGAILDAMRGNYWIEAPAAAQPMSAAPAPAAVVQPAAPAAHPAPAYPYPVPPRSGASASIIALAASIVLVGGGGIGYVAYRDHLAMTQAALVQAAQVQPAPQQQATLPQASPGARRAATAAPAVALPGGAQTVAKAPEKAVPEKPAPRLAAKPAEAPPKAVAERPVKPLPEIGGEPDQAARKAPDDGRAIAAAVLGASEPPRPTDAPKAADAPKKADAAAAPPAGDGQAPNAFVERSKAAAAEGATAAVDARKELETVGAEKAQANLEIMQQVYEALNRSDKISPEMALQLPHDLAQKLREAGAILTPEEAALSAKVKGEPGYKIIRLSPEAYDRLKDADGMPTVPASNSWAATGGNVRLPLPGGGDIKGADDLRNDFHLEP